MVAEKNRVWRLAGIKRDDPLQRVDEAEVEHLVGLVEDEDLELAQGQRALVDQVEQAAGRGDEHVEAARDGADALAVGDAAEDDADRQAACTCRRSAALAAICEASSRVGASTSMRSMAGLGDAALASARRCSEGSMNAAVLPVPVWAMPSRSRPVRTVGIAWSWIGVACV